MNRAGEFEWIARYLAPLANVDSFELKDDAALLAVPNGKQLVVTTDAILENIHFLTNDPVDSIAQKSLRVNISDIVSKGGTPFAYSLALGVPDTWQDDDMKGFAQGLEHDQQQYNLKLIGGDTYRSPERLCVSITMFGAVEESKYISRLGANVGDILVVSGTIGNGALGLKATKGELPLNEMDTKALMQFYLLPDPPLKLAPIIARYATAAMDISDGLLGDCRKLCEASNVSAVIEQTDVPVSKLVDKILKQDVSLWPTVLGGGDDYQCLCTIPPQNWGEFQSCAKEVGVQTTKIGNISGKGKETVSLTQKGVPILQAVESYTHF